MVFECLLAIFALWPSSLEDGCDQWSIIYGPLNNAEMWSYSRVEIEFYLNGFTVVTVRPSDGAGGHWAEVFYSFKMITPCCQFQMAERCYK